MSDITITFTKPPSRDKRPLSELAINQLFCFDLRDHEVFIKTSEKEDDNTRQFGNSAVRRSDRNMLVIPLAGELRVWPKQA